MISYKLNHKADYNKEYQNYSNQQSVRLGIKYFEHFFHFLYFAGMKNNLLDQIYPKDPQSGKYIINIAINRYDEVFNQLDPAPYERKDLNALLRGYLESCSSDIPLKYDLKLNFDVGEEKRRKEKEEHISRGLSKYFLFLLFNQQKKRKVTVRRVMFFTLISFFLLFVSFYLRSLTPEGWFHLTLTEVFTIGGWVFLWEAIAMLTFRNHQGRVKQKEYERLKNADITFGCNNHV